MLNQIIFHRPSHLGSTCGGDLGKNGQKLIKITKSKIWGQNSGAHGGDKPITRVVGGIPHPPLVETLLLQSLGNNVIK